MQAIVLPFHGQERLSCRQLSFVSMTKRNCRKVARPHLFPRTSMLRRLMAKPHTSSQPWEGFLAALRGPSARRERWRAQALR